MKASATLRCLPIFLLAALAWATPVGVRAQEASTMPFEMTKPGLDVGVVVSDLEKAKKFYGDALGLKPLPALNVALPGGGTMVRYQAGATVVKLRTYPTTPPRVEKGTMSANGIRLLTMFVKDPDVLAKRIADHGFTAPQFGPQAAAGYRVGFTEDPDGNRIELLSFGPEAQADVFDRFQIGLTVTDAEKAREFYGKVLGLKERAPVRMAARFAPDTMEYFFIAGASTVKFWAPKNERPTRTGQIGDALGIRYFTFIVKDVDAVYKALKSRGVKITTPPMDLGTVARIMLISDPDGNTIEFAQPTPRPQPKSGP